MRCTIVRLALLSLSLMSGAVKGQADVVELKLSFPASAISAGEAPTPTVSLVNRGSTPIVLVLPGDGSDYALRTPVVGWSVLPVGSKAKHPAAPPLPSVHKCGMINALTAEQVVTIAPGATLDISRHVDAETSRGLSAIRKPGQYRVVFYYCNDPLLPWGGVVLGTHSTSALEALATSKACRLRSNEVLLRVDRPNNALQRTRFARR